MFFLDVGHEILAPVPVVILLTKILSKSSTGAQSVKVRTQNRVGVQKSTMVNSRYPPQCKPKDAVRSCKTRKKLCTIICKQGFFCDGTHRYGVPAPFFPSKGKTLFVLYIINE